MATFRDIPHAYTPLFSPDGKQLAVKSTEGRMAVYDLEQLTLLKKFRFSKVDGAQDDNFCFSPDGRFLYNIERYPDNLRTRIGVYDTRDYSAAAYWLAEDPTLLVAAIECAPDGTLFILGEKSPAPDMESDYYFVAKLNGGRLAEETEIRKNTFWFYREYIDLKMSGFTEKEYENLLYHKKKDGKKRLEELKTAAYSLGELFEKQQKQERKEQPGRKQMRQRFQK